MAAYFAPQLIIPHGITDISFYSKGFGAEELRRWSNEDGTVHVAELSIDGALFHLHEVTASSAAPNGTTTVIIGLFVDDVDSVMDRAVNAGAKLVTEARDYDYDYRQGEVIDPFGHRWLIEKKI